MAEPDTAHCTHDAEATAGLIAAVAERLKALTDDGADDCVLVGIARGGVAVAEALREALQLRTPLGVVDVSLHRDDFAHRGLRTASPSELPLSLEDRCVILVDDVLHTGRTVRAALEVLFERGRPRRVLLATLAVRPGRQLPIQADAAGIVFDDDHDAEVEVLEDPLRVALRADKPGAGA